MFSSEFSEIFRNTFFYRTPTVTASIEKEHWFAMIKPLAEFRLILNNFTNEGSDHMHLPVNLVNFFLGDYYHR